MFEGAFEISKRVRKGKGRDGIGRRFIAAVAAGVGGGEEVVERRWISESVGGFWSCCFQAEKKRHGWWWRRRRRGFSETRVFIYSSFISKRLR